MRKVPSSQKLLNKAGSSCNTHLQINSPKTQSTPNAIFKVKPLGCTSKAANSKSKLNYMPPRTSQQRRTSSGNLSKGKMNESKEEAGAIGELKSRLKELQKKINNMKGIRKVRKAQNSHRAHPKVKETHVSTTYIENKSTISTYKKKEGSVTKIMKKTQSDKYLLPQRQPKAGKRLSKHDLNSHSHSQPSHEEESPRLQQFMTRVARTDGQDNSRVRLQRSQRVACYYIQSAVESMHKNSLLPFKEHLAQSMQTMKFLEVNSHKKPTIKELQKHFIHLAPNKFKYSLVLDLDETLIHCNDNLGLPHDVTLKIKFPTGQRVEAGVNVRPYAIELLQELSQLCEIIVFTASHECYANVVLDHLDPHHELISHRLFRSHCWQTGEGVYIKDLRVIRGRQLANMLLVDNAAYSYFYQLQNGIPIIPFYDDRQDQQLVHLCGYIRSMILQGEQQGSLRELNHRYFQLTSYHHYQDVQILTTQLYKSTVSQHQHQP